MGSSRVSSFGRLPTETRQRVFYFVLASSLDELSQRNRNGREEDGERGDIHPLQPAARSAKALALTCRRVRAELPQPVRAYLAALARHLSGWESACRWLAARKAEAHHEFVRAFVRNENRHRRRQARIWRDETAKDWAKAFFAGDSVRYRGWSFANFKDIEADQLRALLASMEGTPGGL